MFTLTGAVSGAAMTGFTTPGYTLTLDNSLSTREKQGYVSAVTGTQAGVTLHSVSVPFTIMVRRPGVIQTLNNAVYNLTSGKYGKIPFNEYTILTRKGCNINAAGQTVINDARTTLRIYAGTETSDQPNVKAMISAHFGLVYAQAIGAYDTTVTGNI